MNRSSSWYRWLVLGLIVGVLMACRMDMHTTFKTPSQGTVAISWQMNAEEENSLQQLGFGSAKELCDKISQDLATEGEKAEAKYDEKGDNKICTITGSFQNPAELTDFYGDDVTINKIAEENGKFYYDITVSNNNDMGDLPFPVKFVWKVTMPGKVIDHNGDDLDGRTVIWDLSNASERHLTAVSKTSGGGIPTWVWGIVGAFLCLGMLIVIGGGVFWFIKKRPQSQEPQEPIS